MLVWAVMLLYSTDRQTHTHTHFVANYLLKLQAPLLQ